MTSDVLWDCECKVRDVEMRCGTLGSHRVMRVTADGASALCCDERWCRGECGLPAAMIVVPAGGVGNVPEGRYRLRGTYAGYCANVYPWDGAVHVLDAMHAALVH